MLEAHRYRAAAEYPRRAAAREHGRRFRTAPPPPFLRRDRPRRLEAVYEPARLGEAIGGLLRTPRAAEPRPPHDPARQRRRAARATCAGCCAAASWTSTRPSRGADRVTVAVRCSRCSSSTSRARRRGPRTTAFGAIAIAAAPADSRGGGRSHEPAVARVEALLFLSAAPVPAADLAEATAQIAEELPAALAGARGGVRARATRRCSCASSPAAGRSSARRRPRRPRGACSPSRGRRR